jgi:hypothetical protein
MRAATGIQPQAGAGEHDKKPKPTARHPEKFRLAEARVGVSCSPVNKKSNPWLTVLLLAVFVVSRWPGLLPVNFSVVYGLVFCCGAFHRRFAWWLLLSVMLATDIGLNLFYYQTVIFSDYQAVNYLAYLALYFLGRQFNTRSSLPKLVGGGLLGAVIFYIVTNTAAWLQNPEYAKTLSGWFQALTVGTSGWPETWKFFRNTLLSGGLFTGLIAWALQSTEAPEPEVKKETEEEEAREAKAEEGAA